MSFTIRITPNMPAPWNDWYHVTVHTYGSWLRGDPRGWRDRHHQKHADGDYRNPPRPGRYDKLNALSQTLMKRQPERLSDNLRPQVIVAIVEKLHADSVEVLAACIDATHLHILALGTATYF
jgi:hypothetical protein